MGGGDATLVTEGSGESDGASMVRNASRFILVIAVSVTVALGPAAHAFFPYESLDDSRPGGDSYPFVVLQSFYDHGFLDDSLRRADRAWHAQGMNQYVEYYQDNSASPADHTVRATYIDGPASDGGNIWAQAGCTYYSDGSEECDMQFDYTEHWNTTDEIRGNEWLDFITVARHEFGHWIGFDDQSSEGPNFVDCDYPSTNPEKAAMCLPIEYGEIDRNIQQDDMNGGHLVRPRYAILSANDSFEHDRPFFGWKFQPSSDGGSWTRYCDDPTGAYNGRCFVQFNGNGSAGASFYQDIHNGGFQQDGFSARVRVRNRGPETMDAVIVVWFLETGGNASARCSISPGATTWHLCETPTFDNPPDNVRMRIEVYNDGPYNMDIDSEVLGWS